MEALRKEKTNLENAASKLLSFAMKAGAEAAEVCGTYTQGTRISLEKQDFHLASSGQGYELGLRILLHSKQGFSSCNSTEAKELKAIALRAVEIAGFSPPNPYYAICASDNVPTEAPSDLWDEGLHQVSLRTQKEWTRLMVAEATKDPRFRLNEGSVSIQSRLYLVMNSKATHKIEKETVAEWNLMGMAVENENITSFDYFSELSRKAPAIPEGVISSTRKFCQQVIRNLKNGPAKSSRGIVVFSPRAVVDIFLAALSYQLNGRTLVEKTGRWDRGHIGSQVLSEKITLRDMPWLIDRTGACIFDREGTPTKNVTVIEKGRLKEFLLDQYAAKALDLCSTGNASGSPSVVPSVAPHVLCLEGGEDPVDSVFKTATSAQKEFLLVRRFSGQVDPVTGDFSGVAKGSEWWHAGECCYFVRETLISGNVLDCMGSNIVAVSRETETVDSSEQAPTIATENVSVTIA
ncbi:MAG: TldD/PmbA family protein [Deltaproteobacteria bacterium]|nr:TldD/PmbA family protein [Deltaproteobacteria bacterium]